MWVAALGGIISSLFVSSQARAESGLTKQTDVVLTGKELAQKVYDRENGDDSTVHTIMKLINKRGHERIRDFTSYSKDYGQAYGVRNGIKGMAL